MFTEYKRPKHRDVYRYVVPKYAHKWIYLGTQLHFEQAELDIIFSNFPNDSERRCRDLLSRWLQKNADATWADLFSAIDSIPSLTGTTYEGVNSIKLYVYRTAREMFSVIDSVLPPSGTTYQGVNSIMCV